MGNRFEILPDYRFPAPNLSLVNRETLNRQSSINETQLAVCALGEPLRLAYGLVTVGGLLLQPFTYQSKFYLPAIACAGEIDAFNKISLGGVDISSGGPSLYVERHTYLGTSSQAIDSRLQAYYASRRQVYSDTLPNVAWLVLRFSSLYTGSFDNLTFELRSKKVRLTDGGAKTYSKNPAYWLADFIEGVDYGFGERLDWSTVPAVADRNDELMSDSAERRTGGIAFDKRQSNDDILEILRSYAGCFVVREGGFVRLVVDGPAEPVFAFTSSNTKLDSIKISGPTARNQPTVVTVIGTNTRTAPWSEMPHTEYAPGVREGTTPWREEVVRMPGICNMSWLVRETLRRLNEYTVSDLNVTLDAFGEVIERRRGDVVTLSDGGGFDEKPFRLIDWRAKAKPGEYTVTLKEYDPQVWSDAVASEPTTPDTSMDLPSAPPTVTGLTLTEDVYTNPQGLTVRRVLVAWTDPEYAFLLHFLVQVYEGSTSGQRIEAKPTTGTSVATGALQEGRTYAITVTVVSRAAAGTPAESTILIGGTAVLPNDVASLVASVVGNVVRIGWATPSDNPFAIDLRYGATSLGTDTAAFNAATALNLQAMPSTAYESTRIPTGTWRIFAKMRDSLRSSIYPLGRESANPAYTDITIVGATGQDPPPALVVGDDQAFTGSPTLVNMSLGSDGCWVTDMGDTWASLFTLAMTNYTNPLATYHTSGTSSLTTPSIDLGVPKEGTFIWSPTYSALSGSVAAYLETSLDGSSWTTQAAGLSWTGIARYVRGKIQALTTSTAKVCSMGRLQVQVDGVAMAIEKAIGEWRERKWQTVGMGSTAAVDDGFGMTVGVGLTARNADTSFLAGTVPYAVMANGPTAGQSANLRSRDLFLLGNDVGRGGFDVKFTWCYESATVANQRSFVGLRATGSADIGNVEPDTLLNTIGVAAKAGDSNLSLMHNDGSGTATMTAFSTPSNFPAKSTANIYKLRLKAEPFSQSIHWWLTNVNLGYTEEGNITSDIPANTTMLGVVQWINNGTTASTVAMGLMQVRALAPN